MLKRALLPALAFVTLPAAAVLAAAVAGGVEPGDVVEPRPVVSEPAPVLVDAGPALVDAGPPEEQRVEARPQPAPEPVADEAAAAAGVTPAPDPAPERGEPRVDEPAPQVETAAPRVDPEGERAPEPPAPAPAKPGAPPEGFGFGGVPALGYDADNGLGFGVIATGFYYDGETEPYRASALLQIFMTTKLIQDHYLSADWLRVADLPLRLWGRVGYLSSLSQNYCGLGGEVSCDPAFAEAEAARLGLEGDDADEFVQHFYLRRFINPYGQLAARWALVEAPARFELTAGYRGGLFIPGTWGDDDEDGAADLVPYPGSLYERDFPDGEPGFESTAQVGVMLDTRDNEPAPTSGVWLEASARASSPLIGSAWSWAGGNLILRGYAPLDAEHKLVLCNRFIFDGVIGDAPIQSLARVGGSNDVYLYGGSEMGRGIRAQRYLGKLRLIDQTELRWRFLDVTVFEQALAFDAAGFFDAGLVGKEVWEPGPMPLQTGMGGALRVAWNKNFVIRFDLGFSPVEGWQVAPYLLIGNPF